MSVADTDQMYWVLLDMTAAQRDRIAWFTQTVNLGIKGHE